jgi:hypothetical protein
LGGVYKKILDVQKRIEIEGIQGNKKKKGSIYTMIVSVINNPETNQDRKV